MKVVADKINQTIFNRNVSLFCYSIRNIDKEKRKIERKIFLKLSAYNPNTNFYMLL